MRVEYSIIMTGVKGKKIFEIHWQKLINSQA